MTTEIKKIAEKLNNLASNYEIGKFQDIRKEIKGLKKKHTSYLFSSMTIFDDYAFHDGGRTEIQYNIGYEKNNLLRYGLAFSLEPGQTLPDVSILYPQILRYNDLYNSNPELFVGYRIWYYNENGRSQTEKIHEIGSELLNPHAFIFFGKLIDAMNIDYDEILKTFDKMLPIYRYITNEKSYINHKLKNKHYKFKFVKTNVSLPEEREYTIREKSVDINVRHTIIQKKLVKQLIEKYGNEHVSLEVPIFGNKIDVVAHDNGRNYFYEIKSALTARDCIRQAIGQILDYAYWPGQKNADRIFIAGEGLLESDTEAYLAYLNNNFNICIEYIKIEI
jgi:hypothetical protein